MTTTLSKWEERPMKDLQVTSGTGSEVLSAFNTVLKARVHAGRQREKTHKGLKGNKTLFGDNM